MEADTAEKIRVIMREEMEEHNRHLQDLTAIIQQIREDQKGSRVYMVRIWSAVKHSVSQLWNDIKTIVIE